MIKDYFSLRMCGESVENSLTHTSRSVSFALLHPKAF